MGEFFLFLQKRQNRDALSVALYCIEPLLGISFFLTEKPRMAHDQNPYLTLSPKKTGQNICVKVCHTVTYQKHPPQFCFFSYANDIKGVKKNSTPTHIECNSVLLNLSDL